MILIASRKAKKEVFIFRDIEDIYRRPDSPRARRSSLHKVNRPCAYRSSAKRSPEVAVRRHSHDSYSRNIAVWPFPRSTDDTFPNQSDTLSIDKSSFNRYLMSLHNSYHRKKFQIKYVTICSALKCVKLFSNKLSRIYTYLIRSFFFFTLYLCIKVTI